MHSMVPGSRSSDCSSPSEPDSADEEQEEHRAEEDGAERICRRADRYDDCTYKTHQRPSPRLQTQDGKNRCDQNENTHHAQFHDTDAQPRSNSPHGKTRSGHVHVFYRNKICRQGPLWQIPRLLSPARSPFRSPTSCYVRYTSASRGVSRGCPGVFQEKTGHSVR